jgi:hypothetical protein
MFGKSGPLALLWAFGCFLLVLFFVFWVLDTEFFRGTPEQGGQATPLRSEKTALAHAFCAQQVAKERRQGSAAVRTSDDYTAWDLGFNRYLVKAKIERADAPTKTRNYLCKIIWQGGNEQAPESWVVQSIEYIQ